MLSLKEAKEFCRIDNDDEDALIKTLINTAEITKCTDKDGNDIPDIDSTPNNKVPGEDDIDTAEVFLGISTGRAPTYIALTTTVLAIMTTGVILIKKYVL